jgi:hypothetical protein
MAVSFKHTCSLQVVLLMTLKSFIAQASEKIAFQDVKNLESTAKHQQGILKGEVSQYH